MAFYLDCRPALDSWGGVRMRTMKFLDDWIGELPWKASAATSSSAQPKPSSS